MINDKHLDLLAAAQVQPLLENGPYLPFSNSSLRYASIAVLLNDIVINQRKFVVELGAGLTTLLIGKLAKKNNLDNFQLLSIDESDKWIAIMQQLSQEMGIDAYVRCVHAPLVTNDLSKGNLAWYDPRVVTEALTEAGRTVDSILVDGPSAWHKGIELSRFPALPFFQKFMSANSIIFLDDTNRHGEKEIVREWETLGMRKTHHNESFTSFHSGEMFNVSI